MEWLLIVGGMIIAWLAFRPRPKPRAPRRESAPRQELPDVFVVFDLETTGLNASKHKIIELAAIRVRRGASSHDYIQALIRIDGKVPAKIASLTGITNEMLAAQGEPLDAVLTRFLEFIGDHRLVSYNAEFDMAFLNAAMAQGKKIRNPVSCALKMTRRAWPGRGNYRLSDIARTVETSTGAHRALSDCHMAVIAYAGGSRQARANSIAGHESGK